MAAALRVGVVGLGNIGQAHTKLLQDGAIPGATLAAVCARTASGPVGVPHFADHEALFTSGLIDAVLVATPTYTHPAISQAAVARGLHVLMEKPLAMSVAQAKAMLPAPDSPSRYAVMLNQRFHPHYRAIKTLLDDGAIGRVTRLSWTMTAWYRPDIYFQVSPWRGTWPGEGGGLLINQCIHNLDVLQWLVGLPQQVSAIAAFGKYHDIDVEDEFTALLSWDTGLTGVVIGSSGEAPGVNVLDLVGEAGMLRFDGETLTHWRSDEPVPEHCRETRDMFGMPQFEQQVIDPVTVVGDVDSQHACVLRNFVQAIQAGAPLETPATDGLASLQLANGILLAAWTGAPVELPLNAARYEQALQERIGESALRKPTDRAAIIDMDQSYR